MTKGPQGQRRKADVVGNAVLVGRIAIGEIEDNARPTAKIYQSKGGKKGSAARAIALTPERRSEISRNAAAARWKKS